MTSGHGLQGFLDDSAYHCYLIGGVIERFSPLDGSLGRLRDRSGVQGLSHNRFLGLLGAPGYGCHTAQDYPTTGNLTALHLESQGYAFTTVDRAQLPGAPATP